MKMQSFMSQMKEQDKMPERQWNEVKIDNIPEKEFRIMIVKMILDLGGKMEKMQIMFIKYWEELQNTQRWEIYSKESIAE